MITVEDKKSLMNHVSILFGMLQDYPYSMTVEDVSAAINMGERHIRQKIRENELPALRFGNTYRVLKHELILWMSMNMFDTTKLEEDMEEEND